MSHIQGTDYVGLDGGDGRRAPEEERLPPVQGEGRRRQRRLRRDGRGAHPPAHRLPRRARPPDDGSSGKVRLPAAAAARRRRQGPARGGRAGRARARPRATRSRWRRWRSGSRRSTCRARASPVEIPRQSEALYLLQRIRDEAHRFANSFHRELRGKRMTKSVLDDVPGLGPTRTKRLVKELGGVNGVEARQLEELRALSWLPTRSPRPSTPRSTCRPPARDRERRRRRRPLGGPRSLVAGRLHRRRRPGVHRADPPARRRRTSLARATRARRRVRGGPGRPARGRCGGAPLVVGVDPTSNQVVVAAERGGGTGVRRSAMRRRCRSPMRARSTRWSRASCSSTSRESTTPSPRSARVLRPGGRFLFFLNHPLLQTPNSGWIDDQVLDPPEQYWRIGDYLVEDEHDRGGREGRLHPVHPPAAQPLRERHGSCRPPGPPHGRAGAAARLPRPAPRSTRPRPRSPACLFFRAREDAVNEGRVGTIEA